MALMVGGHCIALTTNSPVGKSYLSVSGVLANAASSQVVSPEGPASIKSVVQQSERCLYATVGTWCIATNPGPIFRCFPSGHPPLQRGAVMSHVSVSVRKR
ncbi:MAG: hypothetical protein K0Q61_1335 [Rhodococcus erythropolis]|nr:hypothetical protein [Rhodococcus erythropolis]